MSKPQTANPLYPMLVMLVVVLVVGISTYKTLKPLLILAYIKLNPYLEQVKAKIVGLDFSVVKSDFNKYLHSVGL